MVKSAINSTSTATSGKEQAEVRCSFLKEICFGIADVAFRVAFSESSHFIFFVLGCNVFAEPEVKLLVSFFVGVVISQTNFYLLTCRPCATLEVLQVLLFLLFDNWLGQVLVYVLLFGVSLFTRLDFLEMVFDNFV